MRGMLPGALLLLTTALPGSQAQSAPDVAPYISVSAAEFALTHVRIIDGTGAPALNDQTIIISHGKILSIEPTATSKIPKASQIEDATGYSVLPGLVGMHNHLYISDSIADQIGTDGRIGEPGFIVTEIPYTAPRLYLAAGVTTMRTTGSIEPYADLLLKNRIDRNLMPGPAMDVTAPYLEGTPTHFAQMHELTGPDDATRTVNYWAEEGATSFKAYMDISRAELGAAIQAAHARKLKLTGHLCSVTWPEAIALGIDDFEHGPVFTDTEFASNKKPDVCPEGRSASRAWLKIDINGPQAQSLIHNLVEHHIAVTSTLPVFEAMAPGRPPLRTAVLNAMSPSAARSYLTLRAEIPMQSPVTALLRKEMDFEIAFVKAGGLLLAGPDPTGNGGVLPGFGDQREVELLVEAGFTPIMAIRIATKNGAEFLGREDSIGTIAVGKQADLVLVKGDPSTRIADIENVKTVFKDGVGYDSAKLLESIRGQVGVR